MSLKDAIKHAVFEDDGGMPAPSPAPPGAPILINTPISTQGTVPGHPVYIGPPSGEVYEALRRKTDFNLTDYGQQIQKFLAPLATLNLDEKTKLKTAVLQAGAQSGLRIDGIGIVFQDLKAKLEKEQQVFEMQADEFSRQQIAVRQTLFGQLSEQIAQAQKQLQDLLARKSELSIAINGAKDRLGSMKTEFAAALTQRRAELNQEQVHYSSLLS